MSFEFNGVNYNITNIPLNLSFEGANGSTSFGQNISTIGSPYLSTSQKYNGLSSAYFNGNGAAIYLNNPALNIGGANFVIDFYFKTDGTQNPWSVLVTSRQEGGWGEINNGTADGGGLDFYNGLFTRAGNFNDGQ